MCQTRSQNLSHSWYQSALWHAEFQRFPGFGRKLTRNLTTDWFQVAPASSRGNLPLELVLAACSLQCGCLWPAEQKLAIRLRSLRKAAQVLAGSSLTSLTQGSTGTPAGGQFVGCSATTDRPSRKVQVELGYFEANQDLDALLCFMLSHRALRDERMCSNKDSKALELAEAPRLCKTQSNVKAEAFLLETRLRAEKLLQRAETRARRKCSLATKHAASPISTPRAAATR